MTTVLTQQHHQIEKARNTSRPAKIRIRYGRYVTWIYNCCQAYETSELTIHFAIELFMKYKDQIGKRKLTFASILVASKWCDDLAIHSPHLEEFYTHHGYSGRQISEVEWWLLCKIDYNFHSRQYESLSSVIFRIYPEGSEALMQLSSYLLTLSYCLFHRGEAVSNEILPYQYVITARRLLANGRNIGERQIFTDYSVSGIPAHTGYSNWNINYNNNTTGNSPSINSNDSPTTMTSISDDDISSVDIPSADNPSAINSRSHILDTYDIEYPGLPVYIMDALQRVHQQYKKSTKFDFAFVN